MIDNGRAASLIRLQDGLITREQALAAGLSPKALEHRLRKNGPWQRVLRGVYAAFDGPLGDIHRLRAAILYAGREARVSGTWACWMHQLEYAPPRGDHILVVVPSPCRRASIGFVDIVRSVRAAGDGPNWVDQDAAGDLGLSVAMSYAEPGELAGDARPGVIPLMPPARAVVDTVIRPRRLPADWQPSCVNTDGCPVCWKGPPHHVRALRNVRALMCESVQRNRCTVADLAAELAANPRNHSALARRVLADLQAGCRSAPECELRDLIATSRWLPPPRWNQPLPGARGVYPDACWPEARLVVEVDSRAFHGFGDAPERTERRRARYASLGWTVLPVAPRRIRAEPDQVLAEIEAAYQAGLARRR
jgi:hypothetical protein